MKAAIAAAVLGAVPALARPNLHPRWQGNTTTLSTPVGTSPVKTRTSTLKPYTTSTETKTKTYTSLETETYGGNTYTSTFVVTDTVTDVITDYATTTVSPGEYPTSPAEHTSLVTVTWSNLWTSTVTLPPSAQSTNGWGTWGPPEVTSTITIWSTVTSGFVPPTPSPPSPPANSSPYSQPQGYQSPSGGSPTGAPSGYQSPSPTGSPSGYQSPSGSPTGTQPLTATTQSVCPTPEPTKECIPCEGQPDSDPDNFCGLDINTNWYNETPKTCRTVTYNFTITQETISPDGVPRLAMLVNGQMPGPLIEANWGDTVIVHITNNLPPSADNGTTIHWHGLHQTDTVGSDGVPSITQCPIVPGGVQTVSYVCTNYGTSWYHSHYSLQTWEGIFGPIVINGPASASYDEDAVVMLQDWSHATADSLYQGTESVAINTARSNPTMDLGLINGMNVYTPPGPPGAASSGERWQLNVTSGKNYRLRVTNAAIAAVFTFYVDQHELTVIASDFVPVTPFTVQTININIGQRYDLILSANQPVGNYYMRSDNQQPCSPMIAWNNTNAIVHYAGADDSEPTSTAWTYETSCGDIPTASLVPVVPWNAGAQSQTIDETVLIGVDPANTNLYKWTLDGTTFQSQWGDPTLTSILNGNGVPDYSGQLAIQAPNLGEWVYVIIESPMPLPHPIHLHGHDFLILAQGQGTYNSSIPLNTVNPPRRDTAMMPGFPPGGQGSYLVVAFYTNNPGVWLMHCHIGWHVAMGFALQIIEAESQIPSLSNPNQICTLNNQCAAWNSYASANGIQVTDSGV